MSGDNDIWEQGGMAVVSVFNGHHGMMGREGGQVRVIRPLQRPSWIGLLRWEETSSTQQTCTSSASQRPSLVSPSPFECVYS